MRYSKIVVDGTYMVMMMMTKKDMIYDGKSGNGLYIEEVKKDVRNMKNSSNKASMVKL